MTGPVTGIRRRRGVAGRRETPHLPLDRDFYGQTLCKVGGSWGLTPLVGLSVVGFIPI